MTPIRPRALAEQDLREIVDELAALSPRVAERFVNALERQLGRVARHPDMGSARYGAELGIPGLRHVGVPRFPHLVFYALAAGHIELWRVLHGQRDLPAWLREDT